jgi:hypothetical protein
VKKVVGILLFVVVSGVLVLPGHILAQDGGESLIPNGDFAAGLTGWELVQPCTDCWMKVVEGTAPHAYALVWARENSGASGSAIWAQQTLDVDVSQMDHLLLSMDVMVLSHSLPNSGWWSDENNGSGEYPAKITLSFVDAQGSPIEWAFGFLITHDGSTALTNYQLVRPEEWTPVQIDLFAPAQWVSPRGEPLAKPARLTGILIGGNGWDFSGMAANIRLIPETGTGTNGGTTGGTASGLVVEEYPIVAASEDTPDHFEFKDRIGMEILDHRRAWREPDPAARVAATNAVIGVSGYELVPQPDDPRSYTLNHDGQALVSDVTTVWPIAVSASGSKFALLLDTLSEGMLVVTPDTVAQWDVTGFLYLAPVYVGEDLIEVRVNDEFTQFYVQRGDEILYTLTPPGPFVDPPVYALGSWEGHWVLETTNEVIVDGQSLNAQLGYDEIFGWQLIDGQPFYFFKTGGRIHISYTGEEVTPYVYDQVQHYLCCESSMFNISGNGTMTWFYALRDGTWYYVEAGVYE